ncbi:sensor histidine kinase [Stigmatella hybrida]|uniref:sensor histidine kinase n=1 Tax=Stigmatella hybrida TaxID=394097 RepID=UPI001CDABFB2|nr:sensor histidine kinase [Stigmatella hybrida]
MWAAAGYSPLGELLFEPASRTEPALQLWLLCFLTFGVAFWLNARRKGPGAIWLLGLQTAAAMGVLATGHDGSEGVLLCIVAAQAPSLLPSRRATQWVVGMAVLTAAVYFLILPLESAVPMAAIFTGFMGFTTMVARLQQREAEGRRELARLHTELKAAQVLLADREREQERLRISRELHDSLGHHLTALSLNLEAASHTVTGPGEEHVRRAHKVARTLLGEVREVVSAMRDGPSQLGPSLQALAQGVPGLDVHLQVPDKLSIPDPVAAQSVFRCVQEVITNTLRHASAKNLWIDVITTDEGGIQVHARDDGKGAATLKPGTGLTGMQERFAQLGGRVELRPAGGQGMELVAWLPARGGEG